MADQDGAMDGMSAVASLRERVWMVGLGVEPGKFLPSTMVYFHPNTRVPCPKDGRYYLIGLDEDGRIIYSRDHGPMVRGQFIHFAS